MNCPFMSNPVPFSNDPMYSQHEMFWENCPQGKCQLWIRAYTTEDQPYYNCAFVISAMKNSAGKIVI